MSKRAAWDEAVEVMVDVIRKAGEEDENSAVDSISYGFKDSMDQLVYDTAAAAASAAAERKELTWRDLTNLAVAAVNNEIGDHKQTAYNLIRLAATARLWFESFVEECEVLDAEKPPEDLN